MASGGCRARNRSSCRVHGTGGMYEELLRQKREHFDAGNMDAYIETRTKIEELTDYNQEALDFYKSNKKSRQSKLTLVERMEDRLFDAVDQVEGFKDNIGETISEGVDLITDRHESPISAEIGGSTVAWSDMNPFKSRKLRK
jgi:hypothetical protein